MKRMDDELIDFEIKDEKISPMISLIIGVGVIAVVIILGVVIFLVRGKSQGAHNQNCKSATEQSVPDTTTEKAPIIESITTTPESTESSLDEEPPVESEAAEACVEPSQDLITPYTYLNFYDVDEQVTAKEATNLRDVPSQGEDSTVVAVLQNGEVAQRIAISDAGWSKLIHDGNEYYAVSSLLTTDLGYHVEEEADDGIQTVFTPCNDKVSPKIAVNLRKLPSVTHEDATVVVTLPYGEVVTRTGINTDVGWSRVEYNGEVLYCISSYIYVVE